MRAAAAFSALSMLAHLLTLSCPPLLASLLVTLARQTLGSDSWLLFRWIGDGGSHLELVLSGDSTGACAGSGSPFLCDGEAGSNVGVESREFDILQSL